jgi:hypothetical protein
MNHIISEEFRKPTNEQQEIIDESEARDVKSMKSQVIVKTTVLLKRVDYARIKKICEFQDISFAEYLEQAIATQLEADLDDTEYLGQRVSEYLMSIKDIN